MKKLEETIDSLDRLSERYLTKEEDSGMATDPTSNVLDPDLNSEAEEEVTEVDVILDVIESNLLSSVELIQVLKRPEHEAALKAAVGDIAIEDVQSAIVSILQLIGSDVEEDDQELDDKEEGDDSSDDDQDEEMNSGDSDEEVEDQSGEEEEGEEEGEGEEEEGEEEEGKEDK
jgi:hypothetical protein